MYFVLGMIAFFLILALHFFVVMKVFSVFNSPDGERYRKMRMQGPFVPLSTEEIAADDRRIRSRR